MRTTALLIALSLTHAAIAQTGGHDTPHVVLDGELRPVRVRVVSISRDSISARREDGSLVTMPIAGVEAVLLNRPAPVRDLAGPNPDDRPVTLRLTDGRCYKGQLDTKSETPDSVTVSSLALGTIAVPLESLSTLRMRRSAEPVPPGANDVLLLANGDRVEGFIESVGAAVVVGGDDASKPAAKLDLASVGSITFANPPVAPSGPFLWTAQETFAFESISLAPSGDAIIRAILPGGAGKEITTTTDTIVAMVFDMSRITPLTDLAIESSESLGDRRWLPPPTTRSAFGASITEDLEIAGPASVTWTLPPGASRVAGLASLPEGCRDWGDLTVTIGVDGQARPPFAAHLTGAAPSAEFNIEFPSGAKSLRLAIDAGPSGPIQDRVRLSRTLVLKAKK